MERNPTVALAEAVADAPIRSAEISYECRDVGYGPENGYAEFVYRGGPDWTGKREFEPVGGGPVIFLFPDEITNLH